MLGALNRLHVWSAVGALHNPGTPVKTNQNFFFSQKNLEKDIVVKTPKSWTTLPTRHPSQLSPPVAAKQLRGNLNAAQVC